MPKMKYFQGIAEIQNHYEDILRNFHSETYGKRLLETWGILWEEKELIVEEVNVLRYLLACQLNLAREENAEKPSLELVQRCFTRHLGYLENVHNCHAYNVHKHRSKNIQKQYKACRHYLFKFSCNGWVKTLPKEILTFENKYPDFD